MIRSMALALALAFAVMPLTAYAYIDPNAGGWLFQLLFPLLVAIAGVWKYLRQRIARLFHRQIEREESAGESVELKMKGGAPGGTNE